MEFVVITFLLCLCAYQYGKITRLQDQIQEINGDRETLAIDLREAYKKLREQRRLP